MNPEILCCKFLTQALISFQISISNAGTFKFEMEIKKKLNCKRWRSMFDPEIHRTKVLILNQNMHFVKVNILHAKRLS